MFLAQTETSTFSLSSYYHVMSCHITHCFVFIYMLMYTTVDLLCLILLFHVFIYTYTTVDVSLLDLAVQCVHNVSFMYSKPHLVFHLKFN